MKIYMMLFGFSLSCFAADTSSVVICNDILQPYIYKVSPQCDWEEEGDYACLMKEDMQRFPFFGTVVVPQYWYVGFQRVNDHDYPFCRQEAGCGTFFVKQASSSNQTNEIKLSALLNVAMDGLYVHDTTTWESWWKGYKPDPTEIIRIRPIIFGEKLR